MAVRVAFNAYGGPEVLDLINVTTPEPRPGEVRVRNEAIGLNFIDTYYREGLYAVSDFPAGLGGEGAGVVEAIGDGVDGVNAGDRVAYASIGRGAYADQLCIPASKLVHLPDSISCEEAAAILLKGLTVQYLFRQTYPLKAGDTILFHAAAGGVGTVACQWAQALGVHLIGTVSTADKAAYAKQMGAWETVNYSCESVPERVKALTNGQGCPVVYDSVGKATWEASLKCLKPRGLMVSFGNASGAVTDVDIGVLNRHGALYVTRPSLKYYADTPARLQAMCDELFALVDAGQINATPRNRFRLSEIRQAHKALASRTLKGLHVLVP